MLFNSYVFIFAFLPITFLVYFVLNHLRLTVAGKTFLVFASLFFYGWWSVVYVPVILSSIGVNFLIGISLSKEQKFVWMSRKTVLILGIVFNIGLLAYFKYTNFFLENINALLGTEIPLLAIILPLGISFFTFTQIAFLVDAYKNEVKEYSLVHYMLFVTYFPHLLAGPILHHKEMMPQFANRYNWVICWRNVAMGLFLFVIGLFKKVVIADSFAIWANAGFDSAATLNFFEAWATSLSYTFQLYFDFSGYVDMAIGISLMFNIRLPINFNSPYKARDIQDFWRRWHITLSRFLRDYIYIPLGGNRVGNYRNYINLFAVFLIGGFWHGAAWTFVVWGALHGGAIVIHRIWKDLGLRMNYLLAWVITFNFINITWVFFRAKEWEDAVKVLRSMFQLHDIVLPAFLMSKLDLAGQFGIRFGNIFGDIKGGVDTLIWLFAAFVITLFMRNSMEMARAFSVKFSTLLFLVMLFVVSFFHIQKYSEFIYFQF